MSIPPALPADSGWPTEYLEDFLSRDEKLRLLLVVESLVYRQDSHRGRVLKRRQCDFGAAYSPAGRLDSAPEIPSSLQHIRRRVEDHCVAQFDQLIIIWSFGIRPERVSAATRTPHGSASRSLV